MTMQKTHKFNEGDKVVLKDYETLCKLRNVSENNEYFKRHYDYMKSKEPLTISYYWEPGEMLYGEDPDNDISPHLRGRPYPNYLYNIQTPRSKLYLFEGDELELYKEPEDD